jgi:hypothetical protein
VSASPAPGQGPPALPGYRFLQHLGSGGNAQVYLYEQDMPRRKVAVKVLNEAGLADTARRQFTAEANAMAGLADHPHIVQVFNAAVTPDGRPYLVMQYYPQPNLSVRARRERFSVAEVLRIGIQIGSAVETSHRTGILHRDIKPHNILTGQFGTPALTDFGIAARKGTDGPDGMSVPWSPPEVLYGTSNGDERSDVYSLGATLWHLLGGRSPFEQPGGDNGNLSLMRRIQSDPPPRTQRGDVPDGLERLLRQAMAKDPAARPQTAVDFIRALQAIEQEQRLPLTQIVLAADEPPAAGGPAGSDGDATLVRGIRPIGPRPAVVLPAAERHPGFSAGPPVRRDIAATDTTRVRDIPRIEPWRDPAPAALPGRHRQMPAEVPEASTGVRPSVRPAGAAPPTSPADPPAPARSARLIGIALGGILVIAAIGVAIVLHRPAGEQTPAQVTQSANSSSALGPSVIAPGRPTITVTRASAGTLRFRWTYANHTSGDVFRWQRVTGGTGPAAGTTTTPTLLVASPAGQSVCITVQVVRTDGEASTPSEPSCRS